MRCIKHGSADAADTEREDFAMASSPLSLAGGPVAFKASAGKPPAQHSPWSWHVGRLFGIDVRVHATFLMLLAWVGFSHLMHGHDVGMAAAGVAYVVAVFTIIVLHELGHALTARHFGIATRDITLLPIGGVARLERMPTEPSQELLVALAGPAVNVALAALLFGVLTAMGTAADVTQLTLVGGPFLAKLMWTNVGLAVFNLIPAFPMDGGRVLRALVALRTDFVRATDVAASVGQAVAIVFGLIGLFSNPFLVFIALFVWVGAQEEARMAHVRASLSGVPVSRAMVANTLTVAPNESVASVVEHMLAGFQDDIPVVEEGVLVGIVGRREALKAAMDGGPGLPASSVMAEAVPVVHETDSLEVALERLQESGRRSIPVLRDGLLVGMLPVENVAYVLQVRERARAAAAHGAL
jgi:Zn-dependent protease/predicted transcriptional regulator